MSDIWNQCEGQVIDDRFRLQQYLGGTDDSAVFRTQLGGPQSQKAAIKFIPAGPTAEIQLSLWHRCKQLTHPNLLRLFETGRCRLQNRDRLYVVMEFAEENLSQILPERSLTESEVREMLGPVLDALVFLHANHLVHSRIKPANILATADQLKLSSDALFPLGESRKLSRRFDTHDAPETAVSPFTPAADVWSLGMTLVETLTQHPLALQPGSQAEPLVPETLPQPFLDIARNALRREPRRRWTIAEITARLNPIAAAAAAGHSISPLAVPLSPVPAVPAAKLQIPRLDTPPPRPQAQSPRPQAVKAQKQALVLPNYVVPVAAGLLVIAAIIALPKILAHRPDSSSSASAASAPVAAPSKPLEQPVKREIPQASKPSATPAAQDSLKNAAEKKPEAPSRPSSPAIATTPAVSRSEAIPSANDPSVTLPASARTDATPPASAPGTSASSSSRGEVLDQILPEASPGALSTIHGVVRVSVRVKVDPTGNVSEATLDSPGPSPYFADLALKAARRWQFTSPESAGHSIPSEWLIRFHFTPSGPKAIPTQTTP
jgi:TonB family protein